MAARTRLIGPWIHVSLSGLPPLEIKDFLFPVSCRPVAQKTSEQANMVADTAVAGANEVAQAAVDGVGDAAVASGLVSVVSDVT